MKVKFKRKVFFRTLEIISMLTIIIIFQDFILGKHFLPIILNTMAFLILEGFFVYIKSFVKELKKDK